MPSAFSGCRRNEAKEESPLLISPGGNLAQIIPRGRVAGFQIQCVLNCWMASSIRFWRTSITPRFTRATAWRGLSRTVWLAALVETEPDLQVVGDAADGTQVVELYQKLEPDLVLMDLRMPRGDGITATRKIREYFPAARILMLTTYDGDDDIHKALSAGAGGYLLKNSTRESLIPAIREVARRAALDSAGSSRPAGGPQDVRGIDSA